MPDARNRIGLAMNVLLVQDGRRNLLVDTGPARPGTTRPSDIYAIEGKSAGGAAGAGRATPPDRWTSSSTRTCTSIMRGATPSATPRGAACRIPQRRVRGAEGGAGSRAARTTSAPRLLPRRRPSSRCCGRAACARSKARPIWAEGSRAAGPGPHALAPLPLVIRTGGHVLFLADLVPTASPPSAIPRSWATTWSHCAPWNARSACSRRRRARAGGSSSSTTPICRCGDPGGGGRQARRRRPVELERRPEVEAILALEDGTRLPRPRLRRPRRAHRRGRLQHVHDRLPGDPHRPLLPRPDRRHDAPQIGNYGTNGRRPGVAGAAGGSLRGARAVAASASNWRADAGPRTNTSPAPDPGHRRGGHAGHHAAHPHAWAP